MDPSALEEGIEAPRARLVPLVNALTDCLRRSYGVGDVGDQGVTDRPR